MPREYILERYEYGVQQARLGAASLHEAANGLEDYIEAFKLRPMRAPLSDSFKIEQPTTPMYTFKGVVNKLFPRGA
jgi:hypothetical protein